MTKSKHTKRALLMSVLAMLICVAMLAGSTFAWFTDSVSTGVNKIVAGNLDVELEYATEFDADGKVTNWESVTDAVSLFSDKQVDGNPTNLWEPGHTEVVYLRIHNAGTLALKYKFVVNVISETKGISENGEFFLSNFLVFGQASSDSEMKEYETREKAWEAVGSTTGLGTPLQKSNDLALAPNGTEYVALVVYMPTSIGNDANHKTGTPAPTIDLGVNLYATQAESEEDSFGSNYDAGAVEAFPTIEPYTVVSSPAVAGESIILSGEGKPVSVTVPANSVDLGKTLKLVVRPEDEKYKGITAEDGEKFKSYDIKVVDATTDEPVEGVNYTVELNIGKNMENIKVFHDGEEMSGVKYDIFTGGVEFTTSSFSQFDVAYKEKWNVVSTAAQWKAAIQEGGNIILNKDVTLLKSNLTIKRDLCIDLHGCTLNGTSTSNKDALIVDNAAVTVKNGTLNAPKVSKVGASALFVTGDSNVLIENCTLKTNSNQSITVATNGSESLNSTIVIRNSTISAPTEAGKKGYAAYIPAGDVTFENCNVTGHLFICGGNVTLDGGTYTATGFNGQSLIWNKEKTMEYAHTIVGGSAYTMGDSIFIADRRDGYTLSSLTIRNITFNTEITLKDGTQATAYAIKYVDMNPDGAADRVPYVIENNIFNNQIDGADPVMYIDLDGNDITNP